MRRKLISVLLVAAIGMGLSAAWQVSHEQVRAQSPTSSTPGNLYGIESDYNISPPTVNLVTIDPATGAASPLEGNLMPTIVGYAQGVVALDSAGHHYFLEASTADGTNELATIDTQTGAVLSAPALPTNLGSLEFASFAAVTKVTIDIRPGSDPAVINPKNKGSIPVAILSTKVFDATRVDPSTVHFGATGSEAVASHMSIEDVNGDGLLDMVLSFTTQDTGILCGMNSAILTGDTASGQAIEGADILATVGCK